MSPTPRRSTAPAHRRPAARAEVEPRQDQHALEDDALPDVAVHVVCELVREDDFYLVVASTRPASCPTRESGASPPMPASAAFAFLVFSLNPHS